MAKPFKLQKLTSPSKISIFTILIIVLGINLYLEQWKTPYKVFGSDGLSYYAYLPVTFIYKDIKMSFYQPNDLEIKPKFQDYPKPTISGNYLIPTSMGLAFLISPFFIVSHTIAHITSYEPNGYTLPYVIGILICSLFYLLIGLIFLRKLLLIFFNEIATSITLLSVVLGTNLLYYVSIEPLMAHAFDFSIIAIFLYVNLKWHSKINLKRSILLGLIMGLITLLRPTNVIVILLFLFWGIASWNDFTRKLQLYLRNYHYVLLIIVGFFLVWTPQFLYWKHVTGSYLFYSYGDEAKFFFDNPQFLSVLFSYRKGWLVYTPIMIFSILGIAFSFRKLKSFVLSISLYFTIFVYIMSSWWSWWNGASFGLRGFIDSYSVLSLPFAGCVSYFFTKKKIYKLTLTSILGILIFLNIFQIWQMNNGIINPIAMTKNSFWLSFGKTRIIQDANDELVFPDYAAAQKGIYYTENEITEKERLRRITQNLKTKEDSINFFKNQLSHHYQNLAIIIEKANERNITLEEMLEKDAEWLYKKIRRNNTSKILFKRTL